MHKDCSTNHLLLGPDPIVHLQNSINGNELPLDLFNPSLRARPGGDTSGENVIVENDHIIDEIQKEDPDEHLKFLETGGKPKQAISLIAKKDIQKLEIIIQNEIKPSTFINIKSFNEIFKIILPQLFLDNESGKFSKVYLKLESVVGKFGKLESSLLESQKSECFRLRVVHTQAILFLQSLSERDGSDIQRI